MSAFDRLVAKWVASASGNVPQEEKESMLTNICKNLSVYRQLEDPKAAGAEQGAEAQVRWRRELTYHATPPPLLSRQGPPPRTRREEKPTKEDKAAAGALTPRSHSPNPEAEPPRPQFRVKVQGVDLEFDQQVEKVLQVIMRRTPTAFAATHRNAAATAPVARRRRETTNGGEVNGVTTRKPSVKPPQLSMIQADVEDAEALHTDLAFEQSVMESYTFGVCSPGDERKKDGDSEDEEDRRRLDSAEEDIDEEEDIRRRQQQMKRPSRLGISDVSINLEEARSATFPDTPKSHDKVKIITCALESHYLFSFLDDGDIARFASIMDMERFKSGVNILVKGESNDTLFLVLNGEAEAVVENADGTVTVVPFTKGNTMGDVGLMYESRNEVTITARTALQCASLDRHTYKMITSRAMAERRERYMAFIRNVPLLASLSELEMTSLVETLKEATYIEDQYIIEIGKPNMWMHFILEGEVSVFGAHHQHIATLHTGQYFGQLEFLNHRLAVANVIAASKTVKTAKLGRRQFDRLMAPVVCIFEEEVNENEQFAYYRHALNGHSPPLRDASPNFDEPPSYLQGTLRNNEGHLNASKDLHADDDN